MQDFISLFMEYSKEYESPSSFWKWGAYSAIAATLRFNVFYPHGLGKVYPNIYTVLLADSAEYRKDAALKLVSELLREVKNTKVIEGRASFQAIINDLAIDVGSKNGTTIRGGGAVIVAPELAAFFVSDPQLIPNLTNWYDFREEHKESLKGTGTITIKNRCITLFAASNETYLREVYDDRAVYGGLLRRTFMIKPDETRPPNSLMYVDLSKYDNKFLLESLNEIKNLTGAITRTDAAAKLYHDWYNVLYKQYKTHPDRTGVLQSLHTSALKLAIIISAANYKIEICERYMEEAIMQVTNLKGNYETYAMSSGKADHAEIGTIILTALWNAKDYYLTRKEILFKYWNQISATELDELIATFEQGGLTKMKPQNNEPGYELTKKCINLFTKKKEKLT